MWKKKSFIISVFCAALALGTVLIIRARGSDPDRILARADEYFAGGDIDEARIEYLNAMKADPGNARAIRQMGLVWIEMGAPIQAAMFLKKASETAPQDLEVRRALAKALLAANQFSDARTEALAVLKEEPTDGDMLLLVANASVTAEQLAELSELLKAFDAATSADFHLASALQTGRSGDTKGAKASLDKALALTPDSPSVHVAFAAYFDVIKDRDSAVASLEKASGLASPRSSERLRYAQALTREGKADTVDKAELLLKEVTETSRFYLPAWNLLAEMTLRKKDLKGASAMIDEVLSRDGTNPDAHLLRASIFSAEGKNDEAVKAMEELSRLFPGHVGIAMALANAHLKNGDLTRAGATLDEILKQSPDNLEATFLMAQINLRSGAAIAAARSLEKLLEQYPGMEQAEFLLASAYQAQGQLDKAAAVFRQQITRDGTKAAPHFMLGMILRQQEKPDEALASMEAAQALAPDDETITFQLIDLDIARQDFASAHQRAAARRAKNPTAWSPHFLEGKVYTAEKNWAEAEKALLQALEIQPDSLTVYNLLLDGYLKQGRIPEIIAGLETYLEKKPESTPQRMILAMLYEQEGQTEKQVAAYERILAEAPDSVTVLNNFAYVCAGPLNDLKRAQELASRARTLQPDSAAVADTLGWILFKQKDYAQALPLLEEAATKLPENAEVQYHLGMARYMRGQEDAARAALDGALALSDEFPGRAEAVSQLALLAKGRGDASIESMDELLARLKDTPDDVVARTSLARLQAAEGKFKEAAASYERVLESNGTLVNVLIALADLYAGPLDDLTRAAEYARRARTLDDRNPAAARAVGEIVLRQGDFRYAYSLLGEASRSIKDNPALKAALARAAYGIGRLDEAREAMTWIVDRAADAPEAAEAGSLLSLTSPTEIPTEEMVDAALKDDPDSLPALMAKVALSEAERAAAIKVLEGILKRYADFVPAQAGLGALLATDTARRDEARTLAEKARLALPDDPDLARTLGIIHYGGGDAEVAVRFLLESAANEPLDAEGLFYLGMAHLKAEQKAEGVSALKRAEADSALPESLRQEAEDALAEAEKAAEGDAE